MFIQATLGLGSSDEKSILQCFREHKSPIFLCTLLPDKIESCSLDLEFDEDDSVTFSVVGRRSIHLSGYFLEEDDAYAGEDGYGLYPLGVSIHLFALNFVAVAVVLIVWFLIDVKNGHPWKIYMEICRN